jgi:hypothetical protein
MYKVNIVDMEIRQGKDGNPDKHYIKALVPVQKFGAITLELISIQVMNVNLFKKGEQELDIVLPYSEYPYKLADK